MERIKVNTNFYLDEFVDPHTYFNNKDNGLSLVDERLFNIVQLLRYHYMGPVYINNWWNMYIEHKDKKTIKENIEFIEAENKKDRVNIWSGIRTPRCKIGGTISAHRTWDKGLNKLSFGQAIDPKPDTKIFYGIVKDNLKVFYNLGLRRLEDPDITPGWLHMDTLERYTVPNSIRVVGRIKVKEVLYF